MIVSNPVSNIYVLAQGVIACSISARTKKGSGVVRYADLFMTPTESCRVLNGLRTSLKTIELYTWRLKKLNGEALYGFQ